MRDFKKKRWPIPVPLKHGELAGKGSHPLSGQRRPLPVCTAGEEPFVVDTNKGAF